MDYEKIYKKHVFIKILIYSLIQWIYAINYLKIDPYSHNGTQCRV